MIRQIFPRNANLVPLHLVQDDASLDHVMTHSQMPITI